MRRFSAPSWVASGSRSSGAHARLEVRRAEGEGDGESEKLGEVFDVIRLTDDLRVHQVATRNKGDESKAYWLFGRQADVVDVHLAHASISREHAVLCYREDCGWGPLFAFDLGLTV